MGRMAKDTTTLPWWWLGIEKSLSKLQRRMAEIVGNQLRLGGKKRKGLKEKGRELKKELVRSLREKLKKKQGRSLSVQSRYDFNILWYFFISYFTILVLAFFLVHLLIGVDVLGHLFVL